MPNGNLTKCQGGVYHEGINLFSNIPPTIKTLNHDTQLCKPALRDYMLSYSIYCVDGLTSKENFHALCTPTCETSYPNCIMTCSKSFAPLGNFVYFLNTLEAILNKLHEYYTMW
jgi:hypothetical protein